MYRGYILYWNEFINKHRFIVINCSFIMTFIYESNKYILHIHRRYMYIYICIVDKWSFFFSLSQPNLYPTVGLQTPGEVVDANFGQAPFVFDIGDMINELRVRTRLQIINYPTPDHGQGQWQAVLHKYVFTQKSKTDPWHLRTLWPCFLFFSVIVFLPPPLVNVVH